MTCTQVWKQCLLFCKNPYIYPVNYESKCPVYLVAMIHLASIPELKAAIQLLKLCAKCEINTTSMHSYLHIMKCMK